MPLNPKGHIRSEEVGDSRITKSLSTICLLWQQETPSACRLGNRVPAFYCALRLCKVIVCKPQLLYGIRCCFQALIGLGGRGMEEEEKRIRHEKLQQGRQQRAMDQRTYPIHKSARTYTIRTLETFTCWLTNRISAVVAFAGDGWIMFWLYLQLGKQPYYYQNLRGNCRNNKHWWVILLNIDFVASGLLVSLPENDSQCKRLVKALNFKEIDKIPGNRDEWFN